MRRIAGSVTLLAVAVVLVTLLTGASGGGPDPYDVRAIFDNASFVALGEDVRIAGAPVGTVVGLGVTATKRAAVTLQITNSAFTPFHADATCAIRIQSLIGEKYVECAPGSSSQPRLVRMRTGVGTGDFLLPVSRTTSPVDFDIVQDIYREPVREQFALILNELGTGLAARGSDLNAVIRRANPALGYTDQVLKILAAQNRQLAQLATDSRTVLTPLVAVRRRMADFVLQANRTATASATRARDLARSFQLLPRFLRELRPLMTDLGSLADQATPAFSALSEAAPAINRQYQELAPFAGRARTALIDLGSAAMQQQPALLATIPLAQRLKRLGSATAPTAVSLAKLLTSLQQTGGIQQLMGLLFHGTSATNGFDAEGHYVRTDVLVGGCTAYAKVPVPGCSADFTRAKAAADAGNPFAGNHRARDSRLAAPPWPSAASPALLPLLHYLIGNGR
ncbi:MAG TPA: MlaD family protein [Solirubrobacteraceae bacterium]|nr:MlaD family protein [Solirubrobacteraceae bacterium]